MPLLWPHDEILDLSAVPAEPGWWLFLRRPGHITRVEADSGATVDLCAIELPPAEASHRLFQGHALTARLHSSRRGDFAAVVQDYGKNGVVYDLRSGRP